MRFSRPLSLLLVLLLVVSGCSIFKPGTQDAGEPSPQDLAVAAIPPTADLGTAASATIAPATISTAKDFLPSGSELAQFYDFSLSEGEFPRQGVSLNFTLDMPVADGQMATIARWNSDEQIWEPLQTQVSSDKKTLSATTPHFSEYGVVLSFLEQIDLQKRLLFGDAARPPKCDGSPLTGSEPTWSEMLFFEDKLSPTLWCVTGIENSPDHVVVRFTWSRGTAAKVTTAIKPLAVTTDLLGDDPATTLLANAASPEVAISASKKDFVVQPLGEYAFKFDRKSLNDLYSRSPEKPLINVSTNLGFVALGLAYDELIDLAGPVPAGVLTVISLGNCVDLFSDHSDAAAAIGAAIGCLGSGKNIGTVGKKFIEEHNLQSSVNMSDIKTVAKQGAKKLESFLRLYKLAQTTQTLGSALFDSQLDEITRKLTYSPSTSELISLARTKRTLEFQKCVDYGASIPYGAGFESGSDGCQIMTPVEISHPTYGQVSFVLGAQIVNGESNLTYWLLDSEDHVIARRSTEGYAGRSLEAPTLDGSGNVIYTYNPGRSDGCVAIRPSGDWFEGFGTDPMQVPDDMPDYGTRFYGCQWTDEDSDGVKEILFMPTGGATENPQPISFKWDGSDYVPDGYRPFPDGSWLPGYEPSS